MRMRDEFVDSVTDDSFPTFERRDEDDLPSVSSSSASNASALSVLTALALTNAGFVDVPAAFAKGDESNALIDPFYAFSPVCPASDGVFRIGQRAAIGLAGDENI